MQPHLCFPVFDGLEENCKQIVNVGKKMLKIVETLISCRHFGLAVLGLSSETQNGTARHYPDSCEGLCFSTGPMCPRPGQIDK